MKIMSVIRNRQPSPHARGREIRDVRQWQRMTFELAVDQHLEAATASCFERDVLEGWPEDQANRVRESF